MAYGGSQARGVIAAVAAGLCHSHSNARYKPRLQLIPQLTATPILGLLIEARDRTRNLMVPSRICFHCSTIKEEKFKEIERFEIAGQN